MPLKRPQTLYTLIPLVLQKNLIPSAPPQSKPTFSFWVHSFHHRHCFASFHHWGLSILMLLTIFRYGISLSSSWFLFRSRTILDSYVLVVIWKFSSHTINCILEYYSAFLWVKHVHVYHSFTIQCITPLNWTLIQTCNKIYSL